MRVSHRYKFVFLSMPRTGSTTIRNLLDPYSDVASVHITETSMEHPFYHHMPAAEARRTFSSKGWDWDRYTCFCLVRNPYDRVVSLYHHDLVMRRVRNGTVQKIKDMFRPPRFRDFVETLAVADPLHTSLRNFICDDCGTRLVDEILMLERLDEQLPSLLRTFGITSVNAPLQQLNAARHRRHYRDRYYDEATRRRIAELYGEEIEAFGYEF